MSEKTKSNRAFAPFIWIFALIFVASSGVPAKAHASCSLRRHQIDFNDPFVKEWRSVAVVLLKKLRELTDDERMGIPLRHLRSAYHSTRVGTTDDPLYYRGQEVDALNCDDELTIVFNKKRWKAIRSGSERSEEMQELLILHEYLGILAIEDKTYEVSSQVLAEYSN